MNGSVEWNGELSRPKGRSGIGPYCWKLAITTAGAFIIGLISALTWSLWLQWGPLVVQSGVMYLCAGVWR